MIPATGIDTVRLGGVTLVTVDSLIEWIERALTIDSGPVGNEIKRELLEAFRQMNDAGGGALPGAPP
jgi:hypothetical protein